MKIERLLLAAFAGLAGVAYGKGLPPLIKTSAVAGAYVEGQSPSFTAPEGMNGLTWALYDWKHAPVTTGIWPEKGPLVLKPLGKGYYYLKAGTAEKAIRTCTFCVVPDPATRQFPVDSFYGVDAALSWVGSPAGTVLNWYGENSYAATLDLIRLCGLPHVRERMRWNEASPKPKEFKWGHYAWNVGLAKERGLHLLGMFHDAAPYAGPDGKTPTDLKAVYDFCRAYGEMGGSTMSGWEFWNEPDISFWTAPCWNYMAAMKAAYLGYKAANPSAPVLNGAVCKSRRNAFDELLFRNDLGKYCNVFDFHLYISPSGYPRFFEDLNGFLARMGQDGIERWITESSGNIEGDAAADGLMPGVRAHSYAQELAVAECYPKYRILMQMNGVSRDYFFVFGAYSERNGTKDWGVQRRDGSVKPLFAAISATTEHLVAARIVGEKKVGDGVRCFVFAQPDGTQSIAYWAVSPCDTANDGVPDLEKQQRVSCRKGFTLAAKDGGYRGSNWCGIPCAAEAAGGKLELVAERYVSFLDGFSGLTVDVPARPRGRPVEYVPAADEDVTVAIRADFSPDDFDITDGKTVAELKSGRTNGKATFHVWNLSGTPKTGRLEFANATVDGAPGEISLPAWGEAVFDVRVGGIAGKPAADMTVTGLFDGRRTTRFTVPIRDLDRFIAGCDVVKVDANRADYWELNDSAPVHRVSWDEKEGAVRFDFKWTDPKTDRWLYPFHMFRGSDRRETFDGATLMEFEARLEQDKVENDVATANLMPLVPKGSKLDLPWRQWTAPTRQWQKIRISLAKGGGEPGCDGASGFRLGFNPRGKVVTWWIRNLTFIKPRK